MEIGTKVVIKETNKKGKIYDITKDGKMVWVETEEDIYKMLTKEVDSYNGTISFKLKELRKLIKNKIGSEEGNLIVEIASVYNDKEQLMLGILSDETLEMLQLSVMDESEINRDILKRTANKLIKQLQRRNYLVDSNISYITI